MQSKNRYQGIDSYALSCARHYARILSHKHPCFSPGDYEDIEQELILHFLLDMPKYDPAKSEWKQHVFIMIQRRAKGLRLEAEAQKRGGRIRPFSFQEAVSTGGDGDDKDAYLIDAIQSEEGLWGDAFYKWNHANLEMEADVRKVVESLPERQRQICEWLKYENPSEISQRTGIPRTTISSAVSALRKRMREAGLENYFESASSHSEETTKSRNEGTEE